MINIRRARLADVPQMMPLLDEYARQAEILPRTEEDVIRSIREWVVAETETQVVGMGALLVMWSDLAEVRSLVVHPAFHGQGLGRLIVASLLEEAREMRLRRVFALTRAAGFFLKMGFEMTRIEHLPRKVKRDCVFCPKFHMCDEVAVIIYLNQTEPIPAVEPVRVASANGISPNGVFPLMEG